MNLLVAKRRFQFDGATLEPNERFFARPEMAKVLKKLGRADDAPDIPQQAEVVQKAAEKVDDELTTLRADYEDRFGRKPDGRWKVERLRNELSGALIYERRDMRAEN